MAHNIEGMRLFGSDGHDALDSFPGGPPCLSREADSPHHDTSQSAQLRTIKTRHGVSFSRVSGLFY